MEYGKGKIEWIEFDSLEPYPHIIHGTFLRHGGTSKGKFSTLNAGDQVGDHPDCVKVNREEIRKVLDLPKIIYANQSHGTDIHQVTEKNRDEKVPVADALMTKEKGIGLAVVHADCQVAMFYDSKHDAVAIAHSGWKGLVKNFFAKVVSAMSQEFGTDPENLIACLSPSLGPDHAEYKNYKQDFPQEWWSSQVSPDHFDFWEISKKQLTQSGLRESHIEIFNVCTHCNPEEYFSYRRDKDTGRNATIIALKS